MNITTKQLRKMGLLNINGVARPMPVAKRPTFRKRPMVHGNIVTDGDTLIATLPVLVVSEANKREHWATVANRKKNQAMIMDAYLRGVTLPPLPVTVRMVRLAGRLMDSDNLSGSFKKCRDFLAAMYGVDDGPGGPIEWETDQRIEPRDGIEIRIERR